MGGDRVQEPVCTCVRVRVWETTRGTLSKGDVDFERKRTLVSVGRDSKDVGELRSENTSLL